MSLRVAGDTHTIPLELVRGSDIQAASPMRTFRWYKGKRHYSGWYAAETERRHIIYESRHELVRLMKADMDPDVVWIRAQPMQIHGRLDGAARPRRHVPDYALGYLDESIVIVNVKTKAGYAKPAAREALDWADEVISRRGWRHEVWTGESPQYVANLRWLAAFRDSRHLAAIDGKHLQQVAAHCGPLQTLEERLARGGIGHPRAAVMHMLWRGILHADLEMPIGPTTWLSAP